MLMGCWLIGIGSDYHSCCGFMRCLRQPFELPSATGYSVSHFNCWRIPVLVPTPMPRRLYQYFLSVGNLDGFRSYVSYIVLHGIWVSQPCLVLRDKTFSYLFVIQDHRFATFQIGKCRKGRMFCTNS